ncbi:MAG: BON domain-containing protein [Polyangia bacterium]
MQTQNWRASSRLSQPEDPRRQGDGCPGPGERIDRGGGEHGPISGEDSESYSRQRTPDPGGYGHGSPNHGYGERNSGYAERNPGRSGASDNDRGLSSLRSGGNMVDFGHRGGPGPALPARPFQGRGPRNYSRSSARIREDVCEYLSEGFLDASDIEVAVSDGIVTLSGTVTDRRSKLLAEELAESVLGVLDVENRLRIAPAAASAQDGARWQQPGGVAAPQAGQGELHAGANEPVQQGRSLPRASA